MALVNVINGFPAPTGMTFNWGGQMTGAWGADGSDNFPATWSSNGHQYVAWGDGQGFVESGTKIGLGFSRIEGDWGSQSYVDTCGTNAGAPVEAQSPFDATVNNAKTYAIIAIGTTLYSLIGPGGLSQTWDNSTLYKSTDNGQTWATAGDVVFTDTTHGVGFPGFLQFQAGHTQTRDGYVYAYWPIKDTDWFGIQSAGNLALTRVPVGSIETLSAWEFYTSTDPGSPTWGAHGSKQAAFHHADGVFIPSALYHPSLKRYILVYSHTEIVLSGSTGGGNWGVACAPEPWGPWTTIAHYTSWPSGAEIDRNTFYYCFSQKWMGGNGQDFVLFVSGINNNDRFRAVPGSFTFD